MKSIDNYFFEPFNKEVTEFLKENRMEIIEDLDLKSMNGKEFKKAVNPYNKDKLKNATFLVRCAIEDHNMRVHWHEVKQYFIDYKKEKKKQEWYKDFHII